MFRLGPFILSLHLLAVDCIDDVSNVLKSDFVQRATQYAAKMHKGQYRKFTKENYIAHPIRVAKNLRRYSKDSEIMAAAILHDTLEDTAATFAEIEHLFGRRVATLVKELTTDNVNFTNFKSKADYLAIKLYHLSTDALLIKLADRLDNVSDILLADAAFKKRYTKETQKILTSLKRRNDLSIDHFELMQRIESVIQPYL